MRLPKLFAIVGVPLAGKTTVQKILFEKHGVLPVDDAEPLRSIAMRHFGLTYDDCYTQAGKKRRSLVVDQEYEHRVILGEIGDALEQKFGDFILPWMATRSLPDDKSYSFGSVRRTQPLFYASKGGIVIEVQNPLARPTGNAWDEYDRAAIDYVIRNDGLARGLSHAAALRDLENKVDEMIARLGRA